MSESDPTPEKPSTTTGAVKPGLETTVVPLKKETIRVTLRANPESSAPANVPAPTIPLSGPSVPKPAVAAPTVNLSRPAAPAAPAPTVALRTSSAPLGAPKAPSAPGLAAPAPTVPLRTSTAPLGQPSAPKLPSAPNLGTLPVPSTQSLPKATVPIGSITKPLEPAGQAQVPTVSSSVTQGVEVEEVVAESKLVPLLFSILALLVSAFALYTQYQVKDLFNS